MGAIDSLKPSTYIMAILIFTFFILGGVGIMSELRSSDATFMADENTQQFNKTFNVYADVTTSVGSIKSSVEDAGNDWGVFGVINALLGSAWNALRLLFTSLSFMNAVFAGLGMFGVPSWVGGIASLAVTTLIAFAIYAAVFSRDV